MGCKEKLTQEQKDKINELRLQGHSQRSVSEILGVKVHLVNYFLGKDYVKSSKEAQKSINFLVSDNTMKVLIDVAKVKGTTVNQLVGDMVQAKVTEAAADVEAEILKIRQNFIKKQVENFTLLN